MALVFLTTCFFGGRILMFPYRFGVKKAWFYSFFFSEWGKLFKMNILNSKLSSHYALKIIDSWAKHATHPFPLPHPVLYEAAHSRWSTCLVMMVIYKPPCFCSAVVSQISFSNDSVCCRHPDKKSSTRALVWFRIWMSHSSGYQEGICIAGPCCPMEWWSHDLSTPSNHLQFCSLYNPFPCATLAPFSTVQYE